MSDYREQAIVLCVAVCTTFSQYAEAMQNDMVRLRADTRVVEIDVVVTDSHGTPVTDLTKQDFTVTDNGEPRAIDIFSINRGEVDSLKTAAPSEPGRAALPPKTLPPNVFSNRYSGPPRSSRPLHRHSARSGQRFFRRRWVWAQVWRRPHG